MARNKPILKAETFTYKVLSDKVGKMLGPHPVSGDGDNRTVVLTEKQAKFYLTQGVIAEV